MEVKPLLASGAESASKELEVLPTSTNRTNPTAKILVYNKVPKCGSTFIMSLLGKLAKLHNYKYVSANTPVPRLKPGEEAKVVNYLKSESKTKPLAWDRHLHTLDWAKHEPELQVNLVNMVREPVDKFMSMFYYIRAPWKWSHLPLSRRPPTSWFQKTLDNCVLQNDKECQIGGHFPSPVVPEGLVVDLQLTYFCGQQAQCNNASSRWAITRAMQTVESRYSVVGVKEQFNSSLRVMEGYLPEWFGGARGVSDLMKKKNTNPHPEPSTQVLEILKQRLHLDTEFYQFVKQRLDLQIRRLDKFE